MSIHNFRKKATATSVYKKQISSLWRIIMFSGCLVQILESCAFSWDVACSWLLGSLPYWADGSHLASPRKVSCSPNLVGPSDMIDKNRPGPTYISERKTLWTTSFLVEICSKRKVMKLIVSVHSCPFGFILTGCHCRKIFVIYPYDDRTIPVRL